MEVAMKQPAQVTFRNMDASEAVAQAVGRKIEWLERFFPGLIACRVAVEAPHRHRRDQLYRVRVGLTLPGGEIVAGRAPAAREAHRDVSVAIRDAFNAARRLLQDKARRRRGQVKVHDDTACARVVRIHPDGYGFLETPDGRELYFHAHSVLDGFHRLVVGARVRYAEEIGEKGPQASTVALAGRRTHGTFGWPVPKKARTRRLTAPDGRWRRRASG
jgi:cold shock CspA family protein/ribosome-associated translation inhibitor RaiA